MNEQLQQALVKVITQATDSIEAGVSFLTGQIPDVISQLLQWKLLSASLTVALSLAVIVITFLFVKVMMKKPEPGEENFFWDYYGAPGSGRHDMTFPSFLISIIGPCVILIATAVLISNLYGILQIVVAPKIYLIEYASHLMK